MITLTTLYDEYIGRSKLTEEKEPIYKYSFSPTQKRNNYAENYSYYSYLRSTIRFKSSCLLFLFDLLDPIKRLNGFKKLI